jgi:hypothetical protein
MPKEPLRGRRPASWRLAILLLGALLTAWLAVWAAQTLSLKEGQLRVEEGPRLYVGGRNYPPPVRPHSNVREATSRGEVPQRTERLES